MTSGDAQAVGSRAAQLSGGPGQALAACSEMGSSPAAAAHGSPTVAGLAQQASHQGQAFEGTEVEEEPGAAEPEVESIPLASARPQEERASAPLSAPFQHQVQPNPLLERIHARTEQLHRLDARVTADGQSSPANDFLMLESVLGERAACWVHRSYSPQNTCALHGIALVHLFKRQAYGTDCMEQ